MYNLWQLLGFAVILGKLAFRYRLEGQGTSLWVMVIHVTLLCY